MSYYTYDHYRCTTVPPQQDGEKKWRRIPEEVKFSAKRRKTTKIVTRKILHRNHAKDGKRKKRVRKKTHSDSAILRRKQKRQLQAAFKTIREYQSEASVRQPHPHVGHLQLEPNNFSERVPPTNPQLDFQPPDAIMVRERRNWNNESHHETFSPRGLKNHRRRKSHLDDVYGPNFEEFKEREYRKGRHVKWDQSGHRSSTLRTIKRTPQKRVEFSNNCEREISSRSAVSSNSKKQYILSTDNNKNKTNYIEGCDSKKRSSDIPDKNDSTNINVFAKASNKKNMDEKVKKTPESETQKHSLNLEVIIPNDEKTAKLFDHNHKIADEEEISNSLPVPILSSDNTVGIIHSKRQTNNSSSKVAEIEDDKQTSQSLVEHDSNEISHLKHTNTDHITENNTADSFVKLVSGEKDIESDEETVSCNDFISIDKIDTTKSFLECFPSDDYTVIDMDVDRPSPEKKSRTGSPKTLTETQCKNVYPEINCDQLLNELNKAIDDSNNMMNNVDKDRTEEKTDCKIKPCSKNSSDERMKDAKCSNERTKKKLEKPRSDRKNNVERSKSTNNKMSSLFYPNLANYTIPKKITEKKTRFSDTDEPYMNKMQSLFGIEEDNEDDQKLAESMSDNKGDSKKNRKKRHSTDEGHSQNKKRCTDTKTSRSSRGSEDRHTKPSSKLVEDKSKSNKNSKRIVDATKTSKSTNTMRCKANEGRRNKTNQGYESTESIRLPKESSESRNLREPSKKVVRKSEVNNTKPATESNNAVEKKSCEKHLKMDNRRRNSETPSSNTKLITKRRHSLQPSSSTDGSQNDKLLKKLQTNKNDLKEMSPENDIIKLLEKHSENTNVQVKLICDTNNSNDQIEKVIAEHSSIATISFSKELLPSKKCTAVNSEPSTLDNTVKQMKSGDLDEISSALAKIFESETPIVNSAPELVMSSDEKSTSDEICSVLKQLQEPMIEDKNTDKTTTKDIATTSDVLARKLLEIEETSSKCSNLDADLNSTSPADKIGKPTESSGKMPSDIIGSSVAPCQQLCNLSKISNSKKHEDTFAEMPTEKVQDKSGDIDHKPIVDSNDDRKIFSIMKVAPLVNTAVKSEFLFTCENCCPLAGSLPQFHRVHSCIVFNGCSENATIMEFPDVKQSLGLIRNEKGLTVERSEEMVVEISDTDDPLDDVIEIKPNIPVIDLTKESSDVNTPKVDSKADLLGLLEEGFDRREKITIYRSDETSNNSLEVQAMSASITPINILGTNTTEEVRSDIDETMVAKVEQNVIAEPCVIESNPNTDPPVDTVSPTFAHNVRTLVSQLVDSESQEDETDEISRNEDTVTQEDSTETVETAVVEMVQPAVENIRSETIIPDNSNEVLFIHPESVDHTPKKSTNKTNSRRNSQPNILASNDVQSSPLHVTNQIVEQNENYSNHISHLTRFVYPNGPQRNLQESRLNEAQLMDTSGINIPELAFGNRNSIHSVQQSPHRAGIVEDNLVLYHLTQQEYLITNVIVPYIHLMSCIRRNQADHAESLKKTLPFLPELLKIELKLAEHIYMNKLQIYSGYIVNQLKLLDLTRNMTSVTARATIEYIYQTVRNVNKDFTKTSTILFLKHLMKPHESFYERFQYLKSFYGVIKFFCMEIVRRAAVTSDVSPCQQLTPDQRKILEYQIQQYLKILNTEKCKRQRIERLRGENYNEPVSQESSSSLKRRIQTKVSENQVAERTSTSRFSTSEGQISSVTNSPAELPVALRSPAHRPEGFMSSPAHVYNESNIIPINGVVFNYPAHSTTARSPSHRSEGISPQAHSQRISNNATSMPSPFRSPAYRPEDRQLPASLRSPSRRPVEMEASSYSTITNNSKTGTAHLLEMLRSPAHIQPPSTFVYSQGETNNATLMTAATIRSLVHRPPPPYSAHLNKNQLSNTSLNSLQFLTQNVPAHVSATSNISAYSNTNRTAHSTAVLRSPAHRPESFSASSSRSHFPAALGSPAHSSDRPMNSPTRSSTVAKSPVHQSESQHKFAVPRKPNKAKTVNNPPVFSLIHTSPSRSVCQNSPVHAHSTNFPSMSPDQTASMTPDQIASMNVSINDSSNEVSPRASNESLRSRETPAAATPSRTAMPNLINIRSPVYAPMLFSPPNFIQDESDDPLDVDEEGSQDNCGKDSGNEDILETIDLTWLDDVDDEQIQKEVDFIVVKKEEPDDEEVILNQEQFPVAHISGPSRSVWDPS